MPRRELELLTEAEIEAATGAPSFDHVKCEMVFGPKADAVLAQKLYRLNLPKYLELRNAYRAKMRERPYPDAFYTRTQSA